MKVLSGLLAATAVIIMQAPSAEPVTPCISPGCIQTNESTDIAPAFDLVATRVAREATDAVFAQRLSGRPGSLKPEPKGRLNGADVYSYVWPTSIDSSAVGFDGKQGILALAVTAHPDFDDTPAFDENGDGKSDNDGAEWHSHWVVLVPDERCGKGALKVQDIAENSKPKLPASWPGLPILLDSPGYRPALTEHGIEVRVPNTALGSASSFNFDGVTANLRVNENAVNPLLCVVKVLDVASGKLSLPGQVSAH